MFIRMNIWRQIICWSYFIFYEEKNIITMNVEYLLKCSWCQNSINSRRNVLHISKYDQETSLSFFLLLKYQILIHIHRFIGIFFSYFIIIYREISYWLLVIDRIFRWLLQQSKVFETNRIINMFISNEVLEYIYIYW